MEDQFERLKRMLKEEGMPTMEDSTKPWLGSFGAMFTHVSKCDECMVHWIQILSHTHKHVDNQQLTEFVLDKLDELLNGDLK